MQDIPSTDIDSISISKVYDITETVSIAKQGDTNERENLELPVKYELKINDNEPINIMWYTIERMENNVS